MRAIITEAAAAVSEESSLLPEVRAQRATKAPPEVL